MKATRADLGSLLLMIALTGAFLLAIGSPLSEPVGFLSLLICFQSVLLFPLGGNKIGAYGIYFIFVYIFFGIIPAIHIHNDVLLWLNSPLPESVLIFSSSMILFGNFFLAFVYWLTPSSVCQNVMFESVRKTMKIRFLLVSGVALSVVFFYDDFSFSRHFIRGVGEAATGGDEARSQVAELIVKNFVAYIPFFCLMNSLILSRSKLEKALLFLLTLLTLPPTGIPRFQVGAVYLPLVLIVFRRLSDAKMFFWLMIGAIAFVFPILNQFREFDRLSGFSLLPSPAFFKAAHFDAYENFASLVGSNYISHGYQLLGSLLFFIPRSIWSSKPVGTGFQLAENELYVFKNISMPFVAEGYANFGVIGVVLFMTGAAFIFKKWDTAFKMCTSNWQVIRFDQSNYLFFLGMLMFVARGDLLSSFSFFVGGIFAFYFVKTIGRIVVR